MVVCCKKLDSHGPHGMIPTSWSLRHGLYSMASWASFFCHSLGPTKSPKTVVCVWVCVCSLIPIWQIVLVCLHIHDWTVRQTEPEPDLSKTFQAVATAWLQCQTQANKRLPRKEYFALQFPYIISINKSYIIDNSIPIYPLIICLILVHLWQYLSFM